MRTAIAVTLAGLLIAACGRAPQAGPHAGDDVIFIAAGSSVVAFDVQSKTAVAQLPAGVASADWKHYYFGSGGVLADYNPMTGEAARSLPIPQGYALPVVTASGMPGGLSQNGRHLVLQAPNDGTSHFLVVDTSFTKAPLRIDIRGVFDFDAISNDGTRIYLIQRAGNGHYFVRDYVVGIGLDPNIIFDKTDGAAAMSGVRLTGVPSSDGVWLYSVYARKDQSAFVHELNLDAAIALCVDLTGPGYAADQKAMHWFLAMSGVSGRLLAVNGPLGVVTDMDAGTTAHIDGMRGGTSAVVTSDGRSLLIAGEGVRRLNASTLQVTATALESWNVTGLAASTGGKAIYAISDSGRVAALDPSGHVTMTLDSGLGYAGGLRGSAIFS